MPSTSQYHSTIRQLQKDKSSHDIYNSDPEDIEDFKTRKNSLIHDHVEAGTAIFVSFDIETGGEECGILQISAECFTLEQDVCKYGGQRFSDTFDSYVKPSDSAVWSEHATKIHGLHRGHPSIINADPLESVWVEFIAYLNANIPIGKVGVLVAWNGETCDMEWCYRIMNGPIGTVSFPRQLRYFMDPLEIIRRHTGCLLNPKKSKLQSLSLGSVYHFIHKKDLSGAHNSLMDAKAQTDVVLHQSFKGYWDKKNSIRSIDDMWRKKTIRKANQMDEVNWPLPNKWQDGVDLATWSPHFKDSFEGPYGGPDIHGPSNAMSELCRISDCISSIFFVYFQYNYSII